MRDLTDVKVVISDEKGPSQATLEIGLVLGLWDNTKAKFAKTAEYSNARGITDKFDEYVNLIGSKLAKELGARGWKVKESAYHFFTATLSFIR